MRKIFIVLLSLCTFTVSAQNATKILDQTAAKIKACGNVKLAFTATQFRGTNQLGSEDGTMLLQDKRIQLSTPLMTTWFDGKTQWNYIKKSNEVNVCEPTKKEMAAINPYTFLGMYKKGFRSTCKESTLRGQETYEIHLTARYKSMEAQEVYVDVRRSDFVPLCIRVRQDELWTRIALNAFEPNQQFSDADFTFPADQYPDALVVDLR